MILPLGSVAEALAEANGLDPVDSSYFSTELRHKQWLDNMKARQVGISFFGIIRRGFYSFLA